MQEYTFYCFCSFLFICLFTYNLQLYYFRVQGGEISLPFWFTIAIIGNTDCHLTKVKYKKIAFVVQLGISWTIKEKFTTHHPLVATSSQHMRFDLYIYPWYNPTNKFNVKTFSTKLKHRIMLPTSFHIVFFCKCAFTSSFELEDRIFLMARL